MTQGLLGVPSCCFELDFFSGYSRLAQLEAETRKNHILLLEGEKAYSTLGVQQDIVRQAEESGLVLV